MRDKPKRRWFQFGLKTVMILTAMVCCYLAGWKTRDLSIARTTSQVHGQVLWVMEGGTYRVNLGEADGVRTASELIVSRSGEEIDRLVVVEVHAGESICRRKQTIMTEAARSLGFKSTNIQTGDFITGHFHQSDDPERILMRLRR